MRDYARRATPGVECATVYHGWSNQREQSDGSDVADLLVNFKLMTNVSNTSMAGQIPQVPGKAFLSTSHVTQQSLYQI